MLIVKLFEYVIHNGDLQKVVSEPFDVMFMDDHVGADIERNLHNAEDLDSNECYRSVKCVVLWNLNKNTHEIVPVYGFNFDVIVTGDITDGYIAHDLASVMATHAGRLKKLSEKWYAKKEKGTSTV